MKISVVLDETHDAKIIAWLETQRNKSRAIVRVLQREVSRETTLDLVSIRAVVEDAVRMVIREQEVVVSGIGSSETTTEDSEMAALLDKMEFS